MSTSQLKQLKDYLIAQDLGPELKLRSEIVQKLGS